MPPNPPTKIYKSSPEAASPWLSRQKGLVRGNVYLWYLFALGGCSSYGELKLESTPDASTSTKEELSGEDSIRVISGRAINGYLANALVFQDINADGLVTLGEPVTITGDDGSFKITDPKTGSLIVKPINTLSLDEQVGARQALDEAGIGNPDFSNTFYLNGDGGITTFTGELRLQDPSAASTVNITPISTFVSGLTGSGLYTLAQAEYKANNLFGVSSQLDYIEASSSSNAATALEATSARAQSVAYSNLISSSLDFYDNELEANDILGSLAQSLDRTYSSLKDSAVAEVELLEFLNSGVDLKNVIQSIAKDRGLEIDVEALYAAVDQLQVSNSKLVTTNPELRLINDTGISGVDGITNDDQLMVSLEGAYEYARSDGADTRLSQIEEKSWLNSLSEITIHEGLNTVHLRSASSLEMLDTLTFLVDRISPLVAPDFTEHPFDISSQIFFNDDGNNYIKNFGVNVDFATKILSEDGGEIQYQVVFANDEGVFGEVQSGKWLPYINLNINDFYNGLGTEVHFRLSDTAGNVSDAFSHVYYFDNTQPDVLPTDEIELLNDSGLYDNDFYTSDLSVDYLRNFVGNVYDDITTSAVYRWTNMADISNLGDFAVDVATPLHDGRYRLEFKQVDRAGNESQTGSLEFVLDTSSPEFRSDPSFIVSNTPTGRIVDWVGSVNSLTEWRQYKYVPVDGNLDDSEWLNINVMPNEDSFLYVRLTDRAGNTSQVVYVGEVDSAPQLEQINSIDKASLYNADSHLNFLIVADSLSEKYSSTDVYFEMLDFSYLSRNGPAWVNVMATLDANSKYAALPIGVTFIDDAVDRDLLSISQLDVPRIDAADNDATVFLLDSLAEDDFVIVAGNNSDRVENLTHGDIFFGRGGEDVAVYSASEAVLGLSLVTEEELLSLYGSSDDTLSNLKYAPALKVYSQRYDNADAGGISVVQSEYLIYNTTVGDQTSLAIQWRTALDSWVINLGAGDANLYFGGDAVHVDAGVGNDILQGGDGDDYFIAGSSSEDGEDFLRGYNGNDVLVGGDYLLGSASRYVLDGGGDADLLIAGNGVGQLIGGLGEDVFAIAPLPSSLAPISVEIADFNPLEDQIVLQGLDSSSINRGVYIDREHGTVEVDLSDLYGLDAVSTGSVLTIYGVDVTTLLPEAVITDWFAESDVFNFSWSDLSVDSTAFNAIT